MNLSTAATNGARCYGERLKFRIGVDATAATEFFAADGDFHAALCDALIAHGVAGRKTEGGSVFVQVWASPSARWRNIQREGSGNVIALRFGVANHPETSAEIYRLACNSVQMARDCDSIASGLGGEAP